MSREETGAMLKTYELSQHETEDCVLPSLKDPLFNLEYDHAYLSYFIAVHI